jgi:sterol 14-demethylase
MARETCECMERLGASGEFDLTSTLGPLVMNVAAAAFLGDDFRRRLGREFFPVFRDFSGGMEVVLPLWLPLPRLLRSKRAKARIQALLLSIIAQRRRRPAVPEDFLQTLVDARYSDGTPVPDPILANLITVLVWAGHETTAGHVSWALADLLRHRDYLTSVLAQQSEVLGEADDLDAEQLPRLRRMEWALKETERLNPVAYVLMRRAEQEFELGGFRIEKGSSVFLVPMLSHRLPEVWQDPERYDPERFSPSRAEDRLPYSLIGFGGGVHRCAGVNFAYQEMKVILTLLLQHYELELLDPAPQPVPGSRTKWPQSPCRVRYRRRDRRTIMIQQPVPIASAPVPDSPAATGCPFHAH